jgi:SAM-dependent methyltransferase
VTSHADLQRRLVDELRADLGAEPQPEPISDIAGPVTDEPKTQRAKRAARRVAGPAWHRFIGRIADATATRLRTNQSTEHDRLAVEVELMHGELNAFRPAVDALSSIDEVQSLTVNLELMKGELQAFREALDALGAAIAPAAGLDGVPARFAELRERVNAIDRRSRVAASAVEPAATTPASTTSTTSPAEVPAAASGFDYVGFEHRFRGDSQYVRATFERRYVERLAGRAPVLDVGCGRGELLGVLREHGIEATGIDLDPGMVDEARASGLDARLGDVVEFLRAAPEHSYGAITAIHLVEHLPLETLTAFLDLAATRLVPGGLLLAETPNPASLIVLGNSYILDPTHVWPLHPSLLTFLCERAGFRDVRLEFYEPATDYHLTLLDENADAPASVKQINAALRRLNEVLFGAQEYAIVASTPDE